MILDEFIENVKIYMEIFKIVIGNMYIFIWFVIIKNCQLKSQHLIGENSFLFGLKKTKIETTKLSV